MALLDGLKQKAVESIQDQDLQKKWIEKGFDQVVAAARKNLPEGDDEEVRAVRETAEYGLAKLERHKGALVGLGQHGLRSTITLLGLGRYDDAAEHAALVRLRTSASWDDVTAVLLETAEAGNQAKRDLDAEIEEVKDALKDIGATAAKALLPLLLAVI